MDICGHSYLQAGQCANIVHTVGKCTVFVDIYDGALEALDELEAQGLDVGFQKHKKLC